MCFSADAPSIPSSWVGGVLYVRGIDQLILIILGRKRDNLYPPDVHHHHHGLGDGKENNLWLRSLLLTWQVLHNWNLHHADFSVGMFHVSFKRYCITSIISKRVAVSICQHGREKVYHKYFHPRQTKNLNLRLRSMQTGNQDKPSTHSAIPYLALQQYSIERGRAFICDRATHTERKRTKWQLILDP